MIVETCLLFGYVYRQLFGLFTNLLLFQYELLVDQYAHQPRRESNFVRKTFFGQVLRFLVVDIHSDHHDIQQDRFIYAVIHEANISEPANDNHPINYYKDLGRIELVDLNMVQCLVGRIKDRNKWAIIDRSHSRAKTSFSQ